MSALGALAAAAHELGLRAAADHRRRPGGDARSKRTILCARCVELLSADRSLPLDPRPVDRRSGGGCVDHYVLQAVAGPGSRRLPRIIVARTSPSPSDRTDRGGRAGDGTHSVAQRPEIKCRASAISSRMLCPLPPTRSISRPDGRYRVVGSGGFG